MGIYAGSDGNGVMSSSGGSAWTSMNYGLTQTYIHCLAATGTNLFAGTAPPGGVFRWNGNRWTAVNTGFPLYTPAIYSLAASGTDIFVGTDSGLYVSTNNGDNWTAASSGLPNTPITGLCLSGAYLLAGTGTWDSSLWRRPVSEMVSVKLASSGLPKEFNLEQNYPNPFNPSTTIRYELPHASRVSLKVYNTLGQEVATLVNETKPAGFFTVTFDAGSLASGVYFYRIVAGSLSETKRLLLIR